MRGDIDHRLERTALDLLLYTGKGGVGKTTTAAATALRAAELGQRTLIVSADPAHSLADVLHLPAGSITPGATPARDPEGVLAATEIGSKLFAAELDARVELRRHWSHIHDYLSRLFVHQGLTAEVAAELATLPGAFELATLLAVDRAVEHGAYDLVVVDCAPTASALRMTTLPDVARGMLRVVLGVLRGVAGIAHPVAERMLAAPLPDARVFESAESLLYQRLSALRRRLVAPTTATRLVATPERMVVDEALRAYTDLCLFELPCDALVVNRLLEDDGSGDAFLGALVEAQQEPLARLLEGLPDLRVLRAPLLEGETTGPAALTALGRVLFPDHAPGTRLAAPEAGLRFGGDEERPSLRIRLPGARSDALDVARVEGDLVVTTERRRRVIPLPRRLARLALAEARLDGDALEVVFARDAGVAS